MKKDKKLKKQENKNHKQTNINTKKLRTLIILLFLTVFLWYFVIMPIGAKNSMIVYINTLNNIDNTTNINEILEIKNEYENGSYYKHNKYNKYNKYNSNLIFKSYIDYIYSPLEELNTIIEDDLKQIYLSQDYSQKVKNYIKQISLLKKDFIQKNKYEYAKTYCSKYDLSYTQANDYEIFIKQYSYKDLFTNKANTVLTILNKHLEIIDAIGDEYNEFDFSKIENKENIYSIKFKQEENKIIVLDNIDKIDLLFEEL